jgi:ubiquinone/menaquinone biosynthesis C-methylase UbiE
VGPAWNDRESGFEDPMDPQTAKQQGRIDYSLGRYAFWSAVFEPTSDRLADTAGVSPGMQVLDVAAGDGNTALAAARRGATVIAVDITPAQVRRGRRRTEAEGAAVQWLEGDEDRLPFPDVSFDCALCTFGIEGSLDTGVDEMFRVVRRGGVVGFTEWTGKGVVGALWEPLSGIESPKVEKQDTDDWGNEDHVRSRLSEFASLIDLRRQVLQGRFESVDRFCTDFWQSDPEMRALDAVLAPDERAVFLSQLRRLVADWNTETDGSLVLELSYLLTVAHKL